MQFAAVKVIALFAVVHPDLKEFQNHNKVAFEYLINVLTPSNVYSVKNAYLIFAYKNALLTRSVQLVKDVSKVLVLKYVTMMEIA